jgi:prepilin-type N-terminal cleavage/methylation domain-containing protein
MKNMKAQGFTLVEMLIVLLIFCILMSMLLPILTKALRKAREYEESLHSKRSEPILMVKSKN